MSQTLKQLKNAKLNKINSLFWTIETLSMPIINLSTLREPKT